MPTVSIIIPTFNRSHFLPAAVESAKQAAADFEIIVVDDGSSDETAEVCNALSGIRYIKLSSNQGLAAARNAGIRASAAEFIAFVDDDDLRLPGTIDLQIGMLRTTPEAALCYGRVLLADSRRRLPTGEIFPLRSPTGDIFWHLLEGFFLCDVTVVARRQALLECNLFDEKLRKSEDWDLWLRVTETRPVVFLNEPVGIYRKPAADSEQICSDSVSLLRQMLLVQKAALQLPRAAAAPAWKRRRARLRLVKLAYDALICEAQAALTEGDAVTARAKSREALRLRPLRARIDLNLLRLFRAA
jgi:glycosyltransferase involved in cell wall biosynthesis